jgi:DNA-binding PadR family transcriptional regulator
MIQGAQISNSFILLMVLNEATQGYVEGVDVNDKSLYSITQKGKKLLQGWIAFLSAYSSMMVYH